MKRIIAIGDIHGCKIVLEKMLFLKLQITKEDSIYLLGDLIDRGPDSKGVIDTVLALEKDGYNIHTLLGNHEEMMFQSVLDETYFTRWVRNGGAETLKSFGVKNYSEIPEKYLAFFDRAKYYVETDKYIFVHAGLDFDAENIFEDREAMLWIRDYNEFEPSIGNKILFHGHTPKPVDFIKNQQGNCINLDGGCVYTEEPLLGNLVAVLLPQLEYVVVSNNA